MRNLAGYSLDPLHLEAAEHVFYFPVNFAEGGHAFPQFAMIIHFDAVNSFACKFLGKTGQLSFGHNEIVF